MNNNCIDLVTLSLLACQIGECIDDANQLDILSADLNALADMLSGISARMNARSDNSDTSKN